MFNSSGSEITSQLLPVWSPTAGQEYEFELNWDITNGEIRLFVDGVQHGSTITATGTRSSDIGLVRVGTTWHAISFPPDCEIDDFSIFDKVQHTSDYNAPSVLAPCLNLTVRGCDDVKCSGESWTDINDTSPQDLSLDNNTYFQYKFDFETDNVSYTPELYNVSIDYSSLNTAPTITLIEPQDILYTENESLSLNFTISDDNDAIENLTCWYNLDGGNNITLSNCANTTFNVSGDGSYNLTIYINDSEGLESNDGVNFNVDITGISLSISEPTGTKTSRISIPLEFTATGDNLICWYNVKTSIGGDVIENTTLSNCQNTTFSVATDGDYVLNLFVNNTFGSSDSDSSGFSVDTSTSPPPSGGGGGGSSRTTIIQNLTTEVTVSEISNIVINPRDVRKITWKVKNTGTSFLNDCKLEALGDYSSWFSMGGIKDLAAGEEYEFMFTINIPENITIGSYALGIFLNCQEINNGVEFVAEVLKKKLDLHILETVKRENNFEIIYSLKELSGIDQEVDLQFLLLTQNEEKILEITDTVSIEANSIGEHSISIPIDSSLKGNFKLLININSDIYSGVIQEDLILGKSSISGFSIFGESKKVDDIIALILIIGFVVLVIFIVRYIIKHRRK